MCSLSSFCLCLQRATTQIIANNVVPLSINGIYSPGFVGEPDVTHRTSWRESTGEWLGCHGSPIATGRLAGAGHVGRANRVCLACNSGGVGDERHRIFECTALAPLRQQHADLFTPRTVTMRSFFAQQNHLGVLNYVVDCLNFMNI